MHKIRLLILTLTLAATSTHANTVLITGSNSGIGLEFATQYAADGWTVIATHRRDGIPRTLAELSSRHDNVRVEFLDVTNHDSIETLAAKLDGMTIDLLLNNAGIVGPMHDPTQRFGTLDYERLDRFFATNTVGPLKIAETFYPHVRRSDKGRIIGISTVAASFDFAEQQAAPGGAGLPFRYAYAMSKVALNMAFLGLSGDARDDGIVVALIHPGLVRVARTEQYDLPPQAEARMLDVGDAVAQMRAVIAGLEAADSGGFFAFDGSEMAW